MQSLLIKSRDDLEAACDGTFVRNVEFHESIDSTNRRANQIDANADLPLLVLAKQQTQGRGRGSNRWWATIGSLTFTVALDPSIWQLDPAQWPLMSLATAMAVGQVAVNRGCRPVFWKWPNDVYIHDRKLCGILLEIPPKRRHMLIGVGINVNSTAAQLVEIGGTPELRQNSISMEENSGEPHHLGDVLSEVLAGLEDVAKVISRNPTLLPGLWEQRSYLTGRSVEVQCGNETHSGQMAGITNQGHLRLLTDQDCRELAGGTVIRVS